MNALINHTFRHSSKTRQDGGQPRSARSRKPRFSASTPERPTGRGAEGYTIKGAPSPDPSPSLTRIGGGEGHIMILDYKSGRVREGGKAEFWTPRNPLWRAMEEWTPDARDGAADASSAAMPDPLSLLADGLKTLQLPVYMYLYQHHAPDAAVHAAFVDLARSGAEKPLFPGGLLKDEDGSGDPAAALRGLYAAYIPALPRFVLRHMLECREFTPRPGGHCAWCEYRALCRKRI